MALPDSAKLTIGTYLLVADSTDYADNQGMGTRTDQINMEGLTDAQARESDQLDFTANLDLEYVVGVSMEFATAPASGTTLDLYMGWSNSGTAATNNPGGLTGSDADYTGTAGDSLDDSLKQLDYLGSMVLTADATTTVQIDTAVATFTPRARYGILVVHNNSGVTTHSDAVEMAVRLTPLVTQIQD